MIVRILSSASSEFNGVYGRQRKKYANLAGYDVEKEPQKGGQLAVYR